MKPILCKMHQLEKKCPEMKRAREKGRVFRISKSEPDNYKLFTFKRDDEVYYIKFPHSEMYLFIKDKN